MTQDTRIASEARGDPPRVHHPNVFAMAKRMTTHLRRRKTEIQNIAAMEGKDTVQIKEMRGEGGSHIKRGRGDHIVLLTGDIDLCSKKVICSIQIQFLLKGIKKFRSKSLPKADKIEYDPNNLISIALASSVISLQNYVMFIIEYMLSKVMAFTKNSINFDFVVCLFYLDWLLPSSFILLYKVVL